MCVCVQVQPDEMDVGDIFFEGAAASAKKSFGKVQWGILYDTNTNQVCAVREGTF